MKRLIGYLLLLAALSPLAALAEPGLAALKVEPGADGSETYTVTIQVLLFMTALSLLPAALMMMTSFTRIIIVLAILRQALGTQSSPSNQVLIGLSLFLSLFIMMPIFDQVYEFVRDTGLYEVQVTVLTAFPGTPLYARLEKEGRLIEPRDWSRCTLFDVNYQPAGMSVEELQDGFRDLVVRLYGEEFTNWRRRNFRKMRREKRG